MFEIDFTGIFFWKTSFQTDEIQNLLFQQLPVKVQKQLSELLCQKALLKISGKFTEKHSWWSRSLQPATLLKQDSPTDVFQSIFQNFQSNYLTEYTQTVARKKNSVSLRNIGLYLTETSLEKVGLLKKKIDSASLKNSIHFYGGSLLPASIWIINIILNVILEMKINSQFTF